MDYSYLRSLGLDPTFQLFRDPSGVDNLDTSLTINSVTETPDLRYKLGDANVTNLVAWGYGATLPRVAVATPPTYNSGSPGLGESDDSCDFNASDYYQCGDTTTGNVGTNDIVAKVVFETTGTTSVIAAKRNAGVGWEIGIDASDRLYLTVQDAGGATTVVSAALTSGRWVCGDIYADRSGSAQIYINKTASGAAVDISSRSGTLDSATALTIGADSGGAGNYDKRVAFFSLYSGAAWLDTHLQATVAATQFAKLCGYYPQIARGTALPTTVERTYPAYIDKVESGVRKLYYVDNEWLRQCYRVDSAAADVKGYLPETAAENLFTYSEDFSTWTKVVAGDAVVDDTITCPDGRVKAGSVAATSTGGNHGIRNIITLTAATYTFSFYVKPGNKNWAVLYCTTTSNGHYFDIANGIVGSAIGAGSTGYIEGPFYSGDATPFYRCSTVFTGSAVGHTLNLLVADADNDAIISDGDGSTPNIYFWGAQIELGDYMTSPVRTAGSALTRLKDNLQFVAGDNIGGEDVGKGSIYADILFSSYNNAALKYIAHISDGGAAADSISAHIAADDTLNGDTRATAGNDGDATVAGDCSDGTKHAIGITWTSNNVAVSRDGTSGTADTTATMPDDQDVFGVGQDSSAANQSCGLIQNFRIYNAPVKR